MKILYVLNSNGVGGAEMSLKRMVENRFKQASVITMWGHPNFQEDFWEFSEGSVQNLSAKKLGLGRFFKSLVELRRICRQEKYDIIQTQLKGSDIVFGFLKMFRALPKEVKLVSSLRNNYAYHYGGNTKNFLVGIVHKYLLKKYYDSVVLISRQDIPKFQQSFGDKITVIENAIDIDNHPSKTSWEINQTVKAVLVGNVKHRKGYDKLVDWINDINEIVSSRNFSLEICIAGGNEDTALMERIKSSKTDNITMNYLGKVKDVFDLLVDCDLFLSFSRQEGLPISVLEAMTSKLPILLSGIDAHSLLFYEDRPECLYDEKEDFINKFKAIIDSEALRAHIAESNYKMTLKQYHFKRMADDYQRLYKKLKN